MEGVSANNYYAQYTLEGRQTVDTPERTSFGKMVFISKLFNLNLNCAIFSESIISCGRLFQIERTLFEKKWLRIGEPE